MYKAINIFVIELTVRSYIDYFCPLCSFSLCKIDRSVHIMCEVLMRTIYRHLSQGACVCGVCVPCLNS